MTSLAGAVQVVDSSDLLESLRSNGSHVAVAERGAFSEVLSPPTNKVAPAGKVDRIEPTLREVVSAPSVSAAYVVAKRATDIVGSALALVLLSPLIAVMNMELLVRRHIKSSF